MSRSASGRPLQVALDLPLRAGDVAFTFAAGAAPAAPRGTGVVVPFGRRLLPGIVLGEGTPRPDLRPVLAAVEGGPMVPEAVVNLADRVAREYLSSIGEALAVALPWDALWAGVRLRCRAMLPDGLPAQILAALEAMERRPVTLGRAGRLLTAEADALSVVAAAGALEVMLPGPGQAQAGLAASGRAPARAGDADAPGPEGAAVAPADAARPAAKRLEREFREVTERGQRIIAVAGWNRIPAYLAAIRVAQTAGMSCVIAFASVDAASAFAAHTRGAGLAPVLLHGELAPADRLAAWRRLVGAGRALVVGTRGVVFAPVRDPVLAIVDDEDSAGHKEERAPRYVAGVVAAERTRRAGLLVLGATTPTVATYAGVQEGRMHLIAVPGPRPRIGIIDLRRRPDPDQPISRPVLDAVRRAVRRRGRAILLADRKGYAGGLQCGECGAVERCPQCGVPMPYERDRRRLRCRTCGRATPAPAVCPRCGGTALTPLGAGTERIAAAVRRITARVWRFDRDAVARDGDARALLQPVAEGGGVLVATQLVVPWLEDLRPDLVAVIGADRLLHRPEFRAAERALALLRTVGLASRTLVLVETTDPQHPVLQAVVSPSLKSFYAGEIAQRESLGYPPARSLVALTVTTRSPSAAEAIASRIASASAAHEVLGPVPLPGTSTGTQIARRAPRGRYAIVVKTTDRDATRAAIAPLLAGAGLPRGVEVTVDVDPHEL